jgi:hypothetical protein
MKQIDPQTAAQILTDIPLNLIRRGADGSLVLSMDKWRFGSLTDEAITLLPEPPAPPETAPTVFLLADIDTITWDRLEKQQTRSQVRFRLKNGDLHTFSGRLPEPK